jgi:hypothetical protein
MLATACATGCEELQAAFSVLVGDGTSRRMLVLHGGVSEPVTTDKERAAK